MDYEAIKKENQLLKDENEKLLIELQETKQHLKKYTAPAYKKEYYENNKDEIKEKIKEYRQYNQPTEEQKKKWARTAYLKKKERMKQEREKLEN
jgi:hypothetical protein